MVLLTCASTRLHRLEHRAGLGAADLAHDQAGQVLTQSLRDEVGDGVGADVARRRLLAHADACLQGEHVAAVIEEMGEQFVVGLERAEPFTRMDGGDQRAEQGRLARSLVS